MPSICVYFEICGILESILILVQIDEDIGFNWTLSSRQSHQYHKKETKKRSYKHITNEYSSFFVDIWNAYNVLIKDYLRWHQSVSYIHTLAFLVQLSWTIICVSPTYQRCNKCCRFFAYIGSQRWFDSQFVFTSLATIW